MSKTITRQFLKLFGGSGDSANFGQFGSKTAGAPIHTKDLATIQALDAWINGWQDAVVNASKAPFLEDMNSLFYALCYQSAYLLQEGIPEWNASTTYFVGSLVRKPGTNYVYQSKIDDNLNQALPVGNVGYPVSDTNWSYVQKDGVTGTIVPYGGPPSGGIIPDGWLMCDGSLVSRTTYGALFQAISTTWGIGDNVTTFQLPDFRGRSLFGADGTPGSPFQAIGNASYAGAINHTHDQPAHSHAIGELALQHDTLITSPFTVTPNTLYSQGIGVMGTSPTPSGVGSVQQWSKFKSATVADTTGSAQPAIALASNLSPFAVINWIIKT